MRWQLLVSAIRAAKLEIARLDPRSGMPILPLPPAATSAVAAAARRLGRPLPPSYAEFLSYHDGWPLFYQATNLISARHMARGSYVELARLVVDESHKPADAPPLFPFGVDAQGETIFAWDPSDARDNGELGVVVWMNEIGTVLPDFPAFLEFTLEMIESELVERRAALGSLAPRRCLPALPGLRGQAA